TRVDVSSDGQQADTGAIDPQISADGRYVAFDSIASNLVPGDTNDDTDVFVRDLATGTTTRVSLTAAGGQAAGLSGQAAIAADGRFGVFWRSARLTPDDTNDRFDLYERDRVAGTTVLVSKPAGGGASQGTFIAWSPPAVSADGTRVAFQSDAPDLVSGDTNEG